MNQNIVCILTNFDKTIYLLLSEMQQQFSFLDLILNEFYI